MNAKIERVIKDIEKTKDKINEFQGRLRELEKQKTELENTEIVEVVRSMDIDLNDLAELLKMARNVRERASAPPQDEEKPTEIGFSENGDDAS